MVHIYLLTIVETHGISTDIEIPWVSTMNKKSKKANITDSKTYFEIGRINCVDSKLSKKHLVI